MSIVLIFSSPLDLFKVDEHNVEGNKASGFGLKPLTNSLGVSFFASNNLLGPKFRRSNGLSFQSARRHTTSYQVLRVIANLSGSRVKV